MLPLETPQRLRLLVYIAQTGETISEIARRTGKPRPTVSAKLRLCEHSRSIYPVEAGAICQALSLEVSLDDPIAPEMGPMIIEAIRRFKPDVTRDEFVEAVGLGATDDLERRGFIRFNNRGHVRLARRKRG